MNAIMAWMREKLVSPWFWSLPVGTFLILVAVMIWSPRSVLAGVLIDAHLPSEDAIDADVPSGNRVIQATDPTWTFRYAPIGAEFGVGIPYWIYTVMPKILPEKFPRFHDYRDYGFDNDDNHDYYNSRSLPRGLLLTDAGTALVPGFPLLGLRLKRVTLNCSSCHRGVYEIDGKPVAVDGMPNHSADLQGFKRLFREGFHDPRFTPERVIEEIDKALKLKKAAELNEWERQVYGAFVKLTKSGSSEDWMERRATNGRGRIDAFNAIKIEVIKSPDDGSAATTDFPSIWNQHKNLRPRHHWDGNTSVITTRDFGAVVGIGGTALTINRDNVDRVGKWIERELSSPPYPFAAPNAADVEAGKKTFKNLCANCHGFYDRKSQSVVEAETTNHEPSKYMHNMLDGQPYGGVIWTTTDAQRLLGFQEDAARALNSFGERQGLWRFGDFQPQKGYLAGPLDGIWARAPYLHNGSIPTIRDLISPVSSRKGSFYRGSHEYNQKDMGWRDDIGDFQYETSFTGNSNDGHAIIVNATDQDGLIAYLKTL